MSRLDYRKWDHIEISDDEHDTHPNIDTPSLFRWRHQARLERQAAWEKEKAEFETGRKAFLKKLHQCEQKLCLAQQNDTEDLPGLLSEMEKLKTEEQNWQKKEAEIKKSERLRPWNIDTICHEGKSKTVINKSPERPVNTSDKLSDEAAVDKLKDFVEKHRKEIRKFGLFQKPVDSRNYLFENSFLVCDETANHLVLWCIDLAMEEKWNLMNHVSHQCILMQFMLETAKSLKCDPRSCIRPFFSKFIDAEPEYQKAFDDELVAFRERIRARAKVRLEEAMEKLEQEERQKRLGPGGLDPIEVFDSLPAALQECFEKKDVELLKTVLCGMDSKDAEYHMKRCVDSGLWVDNVNADGNGQNDEKSQDATVYSETSVAADDCGPCDQGA